MSQFRDGPPFAIDHLILYQLMADATFFARVPLFHYLQETAKATVAQIVAEVVDQPKKHCAGCHNIRDMMADLMNAFTVQIIQIVEKDKTPQILQPLIDFVTERRRYRPRPILLYYKNADGQLSTVQL